MVQSGHRKSASGASRRLRWFDRETLSIVGLYTAAWCLLLSASGRYWDDWAALDISAETAVEWSRMQGQFWQWHFLRLLSALPGTERIGHLLVFASYLLCALICHRLVRRIPGTTALARVSIPVLFAVFPVNAARYALIDLMYALSLAVFMIGWWLIAVDLDRPRLWRRVLASVVLLFSMLSTGSLVMFALVIPAYVAWVKAADWRSAGARRPLVQRYCFLLGLPVVAWLIRSVALQPSGLYEGYNQVTLAGVRQALVDLPAAFIASIVQPVVSAFSSHLLAVLLGGLALYAIALVGRTASREDATPSWAKPISLLGAGAVVFALGVIPYMAVGKLPQSLGWESRHQLLVPFGAAMIVYAAIVLGARALRLESRVALLVLCVLVSAFVLADLRSSLAYQADWYKQVSLMQRMGQSADIRRGSYFVFSDEASELNAALPTYPAYAYNGMLRKVFGDTTRFGVDESGTAVFDPLVMREYEQYNCWEYQPTDERYAVTITRGERDVTKPRVVLGLMWREILRPDEYRDLVTDIARIESQPLPSGAD